VILAELTPAKRYPSAKNSTSDSPRGSHSGDKGWLAAIAALCRIAERPAGKPSSPREILLADPIGREAQRLAREIADRRNRLADSGDDSIRARRGRECRLDAAASGAGRLPAECRRARARSLGKLRDSSSDAITRLVRGSDRPGMSLKVEDTAAAPASRRVSTGSVRAEGARQSVAREGAHSKIASIMSPARLLDRKATQVGDHTASLAQHPITARLSCSRSGTATAQARPDRRGAPCRQTGDRGAFCDGSGRSLDGKNYMLQSPCAASPRWYGGIAKNDLIVGEPERRRLRGGKQCGR